MSIISLKQKKTFTNNSWDGKTTLKVWFNYRVILIVKVNIYCLSRCKLSRTIFHQYFYEKCKSVYSLFNDLCMKTLSKLGTKKRSQERVGSSIKIVDLKMSTREEIYYAISASLLLIHSELCVLSYITEEVHWYSLCFPRIFNLPKSTKYFLGFQTANSSWQAKNNSCHTIFLFIKSVINENINSMVQVVVIQVVQRSR